MAIVVAGDLCLDGPKPKKVLQRLEEIGAACIRGNTDRYLSEDTAGEAFEPAEARADCLDATRSRRTVAFVAQRAALCRAHRRR